MSVKVDLDHLASALADYASGYLVTVGDDYRAHTVAVDPMLDGGALDVGPAGDSTRRNATVMLRSPWCGRRATRAATRSSSTGWRRSTSRR